MADCRRGDLKWVHTTRPLQDLNIKEGEKPCITQTILMRAGDVESNPGPKCKHLSHAERKEDFDDILKDVARSIQGNGAIDTLGEALGFDPVEIERYIATNTRYQHVTYDGTLKMLRNWRDAQTEAKERPALADALRLAGLERFADISDLRTASDDLSLGDDLLKSVVKDIKKYYILNMCTIQADPTNNDAMFEFNHIYTDPTLLEEDRNNKRIRKPLPYCNLLKTKINGQSPNRLLVQGEGGAGKTTFCSKIAWDWANDLGFQQFKLVPVIPLHKAKNKTVGEIIKSYLSDNNPVTAVKIDNYILSNPNYVFLVLDGLDELEGEFSNFLQINQIILNWLFISGTVLITSRPPRTHEISSITELKKVYAFIYLEGFSVDNVAAYITKFFHQDPASSQELIDFITSNDVIADNMAPFPIYIAMLCIMWREYDGERRKAMSKLMTFSQLFDEMVDFLVHRYASKDDSQAGPTVHEFHQMIPYHLKEIGKIAFQGILDRRLEFHEDDFQSCRESLEMGCKVGVLIREKHATPRRDRRKNPRLQMSMVQFPHNLFQEYMVAKYLTSLHSSAHDRYERIMTGIIEKKEKFRYVLYFMSAQASQLGLDIVTRLIAQEKKEQMDAAYESNKESSSLMGSGKPLESDMSSLMRFISQEKEQHFIVDVAYESQHQSVAEKVGNYFMRSGETLEITPCWTAHTLSGLLFIKDHLGEVDSLVLKKACGRTASQYLAEFILSSASLRTIDIFTPMHDGFYSMLADKVQQCQIQTVNLYLRQDSPMPLQVLSHSASKLLAKFLCSLPRLTTLTLAISGDECLHDDYFTELASLAASSKITKICIGDCNLKENDPTASRDLARFLCLQPCLTDLTMSGSDHPYLHDDFYHELARHASSSKNHFFNKKLHLDERSEELKQMDVRQQLVYIRHLLHPTLSDVTSHPVRRAPEPLLSHQVVTTPDLDVPSTSRISAQKGKVPEGIDKNCRQQYTPSPTTAEIDTVSDGELITLAADVPHVSLYHELYNRLGIEYNEPSYILNQHGSDSKPAMRECLSVWKNKTGGSFTELNKYHSEGIFDQTGGELQIPPPGLTLSIPPGALPEGSSETISLDVLTDIPPEITLRHDETLVTYGFQCLPLGLQFVSEKPVRLKMPHCANLIDPTKVQVVLYSMNHGGETDRIEQTSRTCQVTYSHVEISLEHSTKGSVAFMKDSCCWKDKRMSFMPFLPKIMPECREMMLELRMVNKPHGSSWRDVHNISETAEYQPAKDDDDEMNVIYEDMEVTCQLEDDVTLKEIVYPRAFKRTKHSFYFNLDFTRKADDLLVKLQVIQSKLPLHIKFRTHFLASPGITKTSLGKTVSGSPRPSPSKSGVIPLDCSASQEHNSLQESKAIHQTVYQKHRPVQFFRI